MILRVLALAGGVTGAAGLSQFPEFTQHYIQRTGGAVDELHRQIARYETDADKLGLSLQELLAELSAEGPRGKTQADNIQSDIARHERLASALETLRGAGPFSRVRLIGRLNDPEIAERTLQDFRPAVPATFEGAVFAGTGFAAGWAAVLATLSALGSLWSLLTRPLRRRAA